jgi:hypothetical protein
MQTTAMQTPVAENVRRRPLAAPMLWGWPVKLVDSAVVLETVAGYCGVEMPRVRGAAVLRTLQEAGAEGPVLQVMRPEPWLVFLAEADDLVDTEVLRRSGASVVQSGRPIALPYTFAGSDQLSWVVPPQADHRWLPRLSTIAWAMAAAPRAAA